MARTTRIAAALRCGSVLQPAPARWSWIPPEHPHNFAWGDEDGKTLYMTARSGLYRIRLNVPGVRP
jgi:hypothetical protein